MRYTACTNVDCPNHGAPFHDYEPAEVIVLCPVCEHAMTAQSRDDIDATIAAKVAAQEKEVEDQQAAGEAHAAANPTPPAQPTPLDKLAALPPDRVVTASELLAILRPERDILRPTTEEKPDA